MHRGLFTVLGSWSFDGELASLEPGQLWLRIVSEPYMWIAKGTLICAFLSWVSLRE